MKPINFFYWLKGGLDMVGETSLGQQKIQEIINYMSLVEEDSKDATYDFLNWFKGFMELSQPQVLDSEQLKKIKNQMDLFDKKIEPVSSFFHKSLLEVKLNC